MDLGKPWGRMSRRKPLLLPTVLSPNIPLYCTKLLHDYYTDEVLFLHHSKDFPIIVNTNDEKWPLKAFLGENKPQKDR